MLPARYLCLFLPPLLAACGSGGMSVGFPGAGRSAAPPVAEEPVRAECAGKPWLAIPPPEDATSIYFVGQSARTSTERDARDGAMIHATNQFVTYTGVEVSIVDQVLTQGQALASGIQDPTISEHRRAELRAQAFVSRVKAREFCTDEWRLTRGGQPLGAAYRVSVLVAVPRDEVDKVQAAAGARRQAAVASRRAERERLLGEAQGFLEAARQDERAGRIVAALENIAGAHERLAAGMAIAVTGGAAATVNEAEITSAERRIAAGIVLQADGPSRLSVEPGETPPNFAVRAVYHGAQGAIPVAGLPIEFSSGIAVLKRGQTGPDGRLALPMRALSERGQVVFRARVDPDALGERIRGATRAALVRLGQQFLVDVGEKSLEDKAADLVAALERRLDSRQRLSVVVENFTYADTGASGPFMDRFKEALVTALAARRDRFDVKAPASRRGLTRGFDVVPADSPAAAAHASGAQGALYGTYSEQGDAVVVRAHIKDTRDRLMASAVVHIQTRSIPSGLALVPANLAQAQTVSSALGPAAASSGDFRLDLWIDKGNGGIYREGEKLYVNVRTGEDCYLKLIYLDAGGKRIVIFPNSFQRETRIKAGRVYQVPDDRAGFDFRIQPPFGAETLVAFASTEPFPPDAGRQVGNGMVLLKESIATIARNHRGVGVVKSSARRAEARVTLTTMGR